MKTNDFMQLAIELAYSNVRLRGGRPFGAVIVKNGEIVATGVNDVLATHDVTAHAEMQAIREACKRLQRPLLNDCEVYASGQPCPMCLAALHWSGVKAVYYAYTEQDAAAIGLGTKHVYEQLSLPFGKQTMPILRMEPSADEPNPMELWKRSGRL